MFTQVPTTATYLAHRWDHADDGERSRLLAAWLHDAEFDAEAYDGLQALAQVVREPPPALQAFAMRVLAGDTERPARRGRRTNPWRDRIIADVHEAMVRHGLSGRRACREIGQVVHLSPDAVAGAVRGWVNKHGNC